MARGLGRDNMAFEPTVVGAAWKYKWIVLLGLAIGIVLAYLLVVSEDSYSAVAQAAVEDPRASLAFEQRTVQRTEDYVADQIEIFRSDEVSRRAAELLAAAFDRPFTTKEVLDARSVSGSPTSSLIRVEYVARDPEVAIAGANAIVKGYEQLLADENDAFFGGKVQVLNDAISSKRSEVDAKNQEISALTAEADPSIEALEAQFEEALTELAVLQRNLQNAATPEAQAAIRLEIGDIEQQIAILGAARAVGRSTPELANLLDERAALNVRIDELTVQRDQAELDRLSVTSGVRENAQASEASSAGLPARQLLVLGAIVGVAIGVAVAYAIAVRRQTFGDRSQPELVLDKPLLGEVPVFQQERIKDPLPILSHPDSASAEAFRFVTNGLSIQKNRMAGDAASPPRVIAVTSALVGAGKSVIAANTAIAAARQGDRVLVVDADFGSQAATELLVGQGRFNSVGITEIVDQGVSLSEAVVAVQGQDSQVLHVLGRGLLGTSAPLFFQHPGVKSLMDQAKQTYDLILLDGPPLLQVAYSAAVVDLADAVLAVVEHGSSVSTAQDFSDRLELAGAHVVGYVYNFAPLRTELLATEGSMRDVLGRPTEAV